MDWDSFVSDSSVFSVISQMPIQSVLFLLFYYFKRVSEHSLASVGQGYVIMIILVFATDWNFLISLSLYRQLFFFLNEDVFSP